MYVVINCSRHRHHRPPRRRGSSAASDVYKRQVYGHPLRHSGSPALHNPALAKLGLDWRYLAFEVSPDTLGQAIEGARAMHFVGLNLTVPHKLLALELVDALDESATT